MTLKNTINTMKTLLAEITQDLQKADGGNKAASQRVRTGTVKLEKVAKSFRKESIKHDKSTVGKKKPAAKKAAKASHAKHAPAKAAHGKAAHHGKASHAKAAKHAPAKGAKKAAPKSTSHKKASSRAHALSFRRKQTAKLPARRSAR